MPVLADFAFARAEDGSLVIGLTPPTNITGWSISFTIAHRLYSSSGLVFKYYGSGMNGVSGITLVNGGQGIFKVSLNSQDTSGWSPGNYGSWTERTDSGHRTVLSAGHLLLT